IDRAGTSGKLLVIGNWGSTNIDQKYEGLKEVLADTDWEIVGDQDGECDAAKSLQAAKDLLSANPDVNAFVGLDSACGGGIAGAMEEFGMEPGSITVICADREDAMIDYIKDGYIQASLTNRTAAMTDLAVTMLVNATEYGFEDVPVSADNEGSGISVWPKAMYTGNVVISADNADNFYHDSLGEFGADNYEG
ncbi:MAG: substrate-binding domain-containing protein, partial [Lachnospiraceae bacterium]|nr:substrate-binding domain-containing protein [Lachnospiraceae bacterium]